jgi:hypothetical protein
VQKVDDRPPARQHMREACKSPRFVRRISGSGCSSVRLCRKSAECVQAAERVAGQHVRARNVGAVKQRVQVRGDVGSVLGTVGCVAPAATGAVIDADFAVADTAGAIQPRSEDAEPSPGSRTTVGLPEPVQCRCSRCPPTSISWPGMG